MLHKHDLAAASNGGQRERLEPVPDEIALVSKPELVAAAGHIDHLLWNSVENCLSTSGWLVVPDHEITSFAVRINGELIGEAEPVDRADVRQVLPRLAGARACGFRMPPTKVSMALRGWFRVEVLGHTREGTTGVIDTLYHPDASAVLPIPPIEFSTRVANTTDAIAYRIGALRSFTAFLDALRRHAREPERTMSVLDWGAGCGRLTAAYARFMTFREVHACDIDRETLEWAARQLAGEAHFQVVEPYPPTLYGTHAFDVVLAYSVLTHLTRKTQFEWLCEMRRLLRPGGLLITSVHGAFAARVMFDDVAYARLLDDGIHDGTADPALDGIAPAGYYRGTYQTRGYTEREWGRIFDVLEYRVRGLNWQDLVVMRAPNTV